MVEPNSGRAVAGEGGQNLFYLTSDRVDERHMIVFRRYNEILEREIDAETVELAMMFAIIRDRRPEFSPFALYLRPRVGLFRDTRPMIFSDFHADSSTVRRNNEVRLWRLW
jgi:hypothetical protein